MSSSSTQPILPGTISPLLRMVEKPDRGRCLVAAGPIKPGQIVLTESPLLLYPSTHSYLPLFCSHCFRTLPSKKLPCPSCHVALFCSPRCLSLSHPRLLCHALTSLISKPCFPSALLLLLSAYSLPTSSLLQLLSLHSDSPSPDKSTQDLHSQLCSLIPSDLIPAHFSLETTASILSKDYMNSFSLLKPINPNNRDDEARGPRAYGIYPSASLFNHDCLPNACQFNYIDDPNRENNTEFTFRALHEITEGSEVCISYVPVTTGYRDRQEMLMDGYGFKCECDRCMVESQWKENQGDEEDAGYENGEEEMEEIEGEGDMEMEEGNGGDDNKDFPHQHFLRYVCKCGGTMAPMPPSRDRAVSDFIECNLCGKLTTG